MSDEIMRCVATLVKKSKSVQGDKYAASELVVFVPQSVSRSDDRFAQIPDIEPAPYLFIDLYSRTVVGCSALKLRKEKRYYSFEPFGNFKEKFILELLRPELVAQHKDIFIRAQK